MNINVHSSSMRSGAAENGFDARDLPLTIAFGDYDRTRPLLDGRVCVKGVQPTFITAWIGHFCTRPVYEEYDVAEMSLSWYIAARCRGEPVIALPIFPLRMPVLAYVFCRSDAQFKEPKDLIGKRIGVPGYRYTVNLWLRGILQDHYGVKPQDLQWVTCEPERAGYIAPAGISISLRENKPSISGRGREDDAFSPEVLQDMLLSGEVDAIFSPELLPGIKSGDGRLRSLFPNVEAEFESYVRSSGVMPITHTMVIGEELYRKEPWIADSLLQAFTAAQTMTDEAASEPKYLSSPGSVFLLERQRKVYGATPYAHGLSPNRKVLETFVRYAHEQGYIDRSPTIESLFAREG